MSYEIRRANLVYNVGSVAMLVVVGITSKMMKSLRWRSYFLCVARELGCYAPKLRAPPPPLLFPANWKFSEPKAGCIKWYSGPILPYHARYGNVLRGNPLFEVCHMCSQVDVNRGLVHSWFINGGGLIQTDRRGKGIIEIFYMGTYRALVRA